MANKWPILTIGPTAPSMFLDNQVYKKEKLDDGNYLFETNKETCLKWLDKRETNSVIYVSFGSVASIGEEQMNEVAEALIKTNCYFLWVVRVEEENKLPKHFGYEKGLIINWCPQLDVLAHKSVACFITHCGWNSTLEALSSGVPMIGVPQWVDQTTNAKCIEDVWKSGIRVKINEKGIVKREEFERCIKEVIESEKGKELKRNAMKWKELAKEAMSDGGSSDRNIEQFASTLNFYVV